MYQCNNTSASLLKDVILKVCCILELQKRFVILITNAH